MENELPAIGIGEEVLTKERDENEGAEADSEKARNKHLSQRNQPGKQRGIGNANTFKDPLESSLENRKWVPRLRTTVLLLLQQIHRQRRHQRSRQDIGRQHGKDYGLSERNKEVPGNAAEKEHGKKYDADTQCGNQRRDSNLCGSIQNPIVQLGALFKMPLDIFNSDGRVVDQYANRQREPTQCHDVDRLVKETVHDD